jgi:hypothetical protein
MFTRGAIIAIAMLVGAGCNASGAGDPGAPSPVAHPETVSVDFFAGTKASAACSGTLLAPNLVLTAAHCAGSATSARVIAPDAKGQRSSVERVSVLDWDFGGTSEENAQRHDIAVLVLSRAITIDSYPAIDTGFCGGCTVVHVARGKDRAGPALESAPLRLSDLPSPSRPFAQTVAATMHTAGGALVRKDAAGRSIIDGVMSGS